MAARDLDEAPAFKFVLEQFAIRISTFQDSVGMAERIGKLRVSKVVKAGWGYGRKVGSLGRLSAEGWQHRQRRLGLQVTSLYSEVRRRSARTTVSYLPSAAVGHLNAVGSRRAEALPVQMIGEANSMRWLPGSCIHPEQGSCD
jgi:hypothetical protein